LDDPLDRICMDEQVPVPPSCNTIQIHKKKRPLWDALCAVLRVYANVHHTMNYVNEVIWLSFIRAAIMSILPEAAHIHAAHDE
jgi:hypothetical protein